MVSVGAWCARAFANISSKMINTLTNSVNMRQRIWEEGYHILYVTVLFICMRYIFIDQLLSQRMCLETSKSNVVRLWCYYFPCSKYVARDMTGRGREQTLEYILWSILSIMQIQSRHWDINAMFNCPIYALLIIYTRVDCQWLFLRIKPTRG